MRSGNGNGGATGTGALHAIHVRPHADRRPWARSAIVAVAAVFASMVVPLGITSAAAADVTTPGPASMDAGGIHTCVVTSGGGVKCWGYNFYGQLGDGTRISRPDPQFVPGLESGVEAVSAAGQSTCAVTTAGGVKCWGTNRFGELGDGTHTDRLSPVDVVGLSSGVIAVAASYFHTCALMNTGAVKCWGSNASGELGIGTFGGDRTTPVDVLGLSGVAAIAGGDDDGLAEQTCALTGGGGVKCWGSNVYGQLGDGTTTSRSTPVDVSGLTSGVASISAGGGVSCAVTVAGEAKCWGLNEHGQLGDGTTTSRSIPVTVAGSSSGIAQIAISQSSQHLSHLCATTTAGAVRCWGYNANSQVGNGSSGPDVLTPAPVVGLGSGYVGVATSFYHSCALSVAGAVKCWGANQYSEIGDGTTIGRVTPVDVSGSFFRPECPNLIAQDHTGFTSSDGYAVGSIATFTADPGFDLAGSATTTCRTDLTWSDPPPGVALRPVTLAVTPSADLSGGQTVSVSVGQITPGAPRRLVSGRPGGRPAEHRVLRCQHDLHPGRRAIRHHQRDDPPRAVHLRAGPGQMGRLRGLR